MIAVYLNWCEQCSGIHSIELVIVVEQCNLMSIHMHSPSSPTMVGVVSWQGFTGGASLSW